MTETIFAKAIWIRIRNVFVVALLAAMVLGLVARPANATHTMTCEIIDGTRVCTPDIHENTAPTVGVDNTSMTVTEGQRVTNTGTYSDSETGDVAIEVWVSAPGGIPSVAAPLPRPAPTAEPGVVLLSPPAKVGSVHLIPSVATTTALRPCRSPSSPTIAMARRDKGVSL